MSQADVDERGLRPQIRRVWKEYLRLQPQIHLAFHGRPVLMGERQLLNEYRSQLTTLLGEVTITAGPAEEEVQRRVDALLQTINQRQAVLRKLSGRKFRRSDVAAASVALHLDRLQRIADRRTLLAWVQRRHSLQALLLVDEFTRVSRSRGTRESAFASLDQIVERLQQRTQRQPPTITAEGVNAVISFHRRVVQNRSLLVAHPLTPESMISCLELARPALSGPVVADIDAMLVNLHRRQQEFVTARQSASLDSILHDTATALIRRKQELDELIRQTGLRKKSPAQMNEFKLDLALWYWLTCELHLQSMMLLPAGHDMALPIVHDLHALIGSAHRVAIWERTRQAASEKSRP
jgi:hypothetical protein